jgi:hypothetical protein
VSSALRRHGDALLCVVPAGLHHPVHYRQLVFVFTHEGLIIDAVLGGIVQGHQFADV